MNESTFLNSFWCVCVHLKLALKYVNIYYHRLLYLPCLVKLSRDSYLSEVMMGYLKTNLLKTGGKDWSNL